MVTSIDGAGRWRIQEQQDRAELRDYAACEHLGILQGLHCASVSWILVFLRHHVYLFFLYIFIWGEHILQQLSEKGCTGSKIF